MASEWDFLIIALIKKVDKKITAVWLMLETTIVGNFTEQFQ